MPIEMVKDDVADDVSAAIASLRSESTEPAAEPAPEPVKEPAEVAPTQGELEADKPAVKTDATGRLHGEKGKFVPKDKSDGQQAPAPKEAQPVPSTESPEQAAAAPRPPRGWSVAAKTAWAKLPKEVQEAVANRDQEVEKGFAEYQPYKELKPFVDRCARTGQKPMDVLSAYLGIEDTIRRDPAQGMAQIASNVGMSNAQAGELFMRLAQHYGALQPQSAVQSGGDMGQTGLDPNVLQRMVAQYVDPVGQRIQQLEQTLTRQQQLHQQQREGQASQIIEQFRSDSKYPYYDNVEQIIGDLLEKGMVQRTGDFSRDLDAAYQMACWQHPEVRDALIKEQQSKAEAERQASAKAAADKARQASRSVTGSPSPDAAARRTAERQNGANYDDDLRNDVAAAIRSVSARA